MTSDSQECSSAACTPRSKRRVSWRRRSKPTMSETTVVLLALECARHVARAVLQAELQLRIQLPVRMQVVHQARRLERLEGTGLVVVLELEPVEHDPAARIRAEGPGVTAHGLRGLAEPSAPNRRPAARPTWHGLRAARGTSPWSSSSAPPNRNCDARGGSCICQSSWRYEAPTNAAKKSSVMRARGQRRIRIQRLEVRAAQRVGLVHADVERPALLEHEALRQAEVRERARADTPWPGC